MCGFDEFVEMWSVGSGCDNESSFGLVVRDSKHS